MTQGSIYIGTSGWSYPKDKGTWNRYFYPADKKLDELAYYSHFFSMVEINSSFYRPPESRLFQNWINLVPESFLFTIKLWQKFTHPKMFKQATGEEATISTDDIDLFCEGIEPLVKSAKLGALLAQFPPSFINDEFGRQILGGLINQFRDFPSSNRTQT